MNKKKVFCIIAIILVLGIIGIWFGVKKNQKPNIDNSGEQLSEEEIITGLEPLEIFEIQEPVKIEGEKQYKGLTLSNFEVQLITARQCEVRANVRNETNALIEMQNIKLELYDVEGNLLETIGAQIDSVEPGGHTEVFAMLRRDDASDIAKIEISEN